ACWRPPARTTSSSSRATFFFQAEDGIRYFHVTGVQTCALPIYLPEDAETFETDAQRLVQLVRVRDPRIGIPPSPRKKRAAKPIQIGRASCRERGELSRGAVRPQEEQSGPRCLRAGGAAVRQRHR